MNSGMPPSLKSKDAESEITSPMWKRLGKIWQRIFALLFIIVEQGIASWGRKNDQKSKYQNSTELLRPPSLPFPPTTAIHISLKNWADVKSILAKSIFQFQFQTWSCRASNCFFMSSICSSFWCDELSVFSFFSVKVATWDWRFSNSVSYFISWGTDRRKSITHI